MSVTYLEFKDLKKNEWNKIINQFEGNVSQYYYDMIKYHISFFKSENLSFILSVNSKPVAAATFGILKQGDSHNICFGGADSYFPSPIFEKNLNSYEKRRIIDIVINKIFEIAKNKKIKNINMITYPITHCIEKKKFKISSEDQFLFMQYFDQLKIINSCIINLNKKLDDLWQELSSDRKKNINKIIKKKLDFNIFDNKKDKRECLRVFKHFKETHFISSGRKTRSDESWDIMYQMLLNGDAKLFTLGHNQNTISFLFVGEFENYSLSWSQANVEEYEKEFTPRHLLEWNVIKFYKEMGFDFYDIGEIYFDYCDYSFSDKEKNISNFKMKFGGNLFPRAYYQKRIYENLAKN